MDWHTDDHGRQLWRRVRWGAVVLVLLLPLGAMWLGAPVAWDGGDFAAAALLLAGACGIYEVAGSGRSARRRIAVGVALFLVVAVAWVQGAVGLF